MENTKDRAKKILQKMESQSADKENLAKERAKRIFDSGALDYDSRSADLKKQLAGELGSGKFDANASKGLVKEYAAVQFKIFDNNLKRGNKSIKPVGENLSNLFKAHGYDFNELYPDLAKDFSTGNIEGYAYNNSEAFKKEFNEKQHRKATQGAVVASYAAQNKKNQHERNAEKIAAEDKEKAAAYNAELERLNGEVDWNSLTPDERLGVSNANKIKAMQNTGYYKNPVGFSMTPEEAAERKAAAEASREKIYADEALYAINTMRDVMAKPDFEKKSAAISEEAKEKDTGSFILDLYNDISYDEKPAGFTEDMWKTYVYIRNTEGLEAAEKFKKGIENTTNLIGSEKISEALQKAEDAGGLSMFLSGAMQGGYALASGAEGIGQAFKGIGDTFTGNTEYFMPGTSQMVTAKNKEDASLLGRLALGATEGIPQVAGAAATGAINPYLGAAFLGATAYGSSYVDAKNSGATQAQAIGMGVASAALEIALEKYIGSTIEGFGTSLSGKAASGLSKTKLGQSFITSFDDFAKAHPKGAVALATVGNMFGNSSSEFVEEYLAETASPMLRNVFLGENNEFTLWSDEQKEAGLIGFITGGILEGARAGITLSNLGTDYGVRVETIKAMSDGKALSEYKAKFGSDAESADKARAFLIESERFIASTVAVSEYAKEGLSYEEAVEKAKKQGVDVSGFEEFTKAAYDIGRTGAVSPAGLYEKLTYKGGAYSDIGRLIGEGEATSYIADRIVGLDKSVSRSEAINAVNEAKQRAFAQSLENTAMSDFEKSNAIKEYVLKEQALDRMYQLGFRGFEFDVSMGAGLISEADAYKAFTRGENARMLSQGQSVEVGSVEAVSENLAEAMQQLQNAERLSNIPESPMAPIMEDDGDVAFEDESADERALSQPNVVIDNMGSMGRTLYNKIVDPIAKNATTAKDISAARSGFAHVYEAGQKGKDVKRSKAGPLHIKEINAIYEAGKKDAAARANVKKKTDAKVIKDDSFTKAKVSKRTERILGGVAKVVGRDIRFSDDIEGNAKIDLATGEIIISTKAKSGHTWAMIHEVYHALVVDSPAEAAVLKKTVLDIARKNPALYKKLKGIYAEKYYNELLDENGKLRADAEEYLTDEMAADLIGYTLSDPAILEKLTGQQRTVLQKFVDKLVSMFGDKNMKAAKEYLSNADGDIRAIFKDVAREADSIAEQFKAALDTSQKAEKNTVERDGVRNSLILDWSNGDKTTISNISNITNEQILGLLNDAKKGVIRRDSYIPVRAHTPQNAINAMANIGKTIEDRPLIMRVSKAQQAMKSEGSSKPKHAKRGHSLSPEKLFEILERLDEATDIIYQSNRVNDKGENLPDNVVFVVEYELDGTESVAIVEFNSSIEEKNIDNSDEESNFHTVVTVFTPDTERNGYEFDYVERLLENPDNYSIKEEKSTSDEGATGEKAPNTFENEDALFTNSISKDKGNVNRNSRDIFTKADEDYMKAVESGDMETAQRMVDEAAESSMPDSEVRNKRGKLVRVYHGTSRGGFTVFDTYAYHSRFGLFGNGAYFTEGRSIAEQYTSKGKGDKPQIYDAYLNITNPLDMDAKAAISLWKKALERADLGYVNLSEGMTNEDAFREVVETLADEGYVSYEAEEIVRNIFENMGYDGITHIGGGRAGKSDGTRHRVWIAFESEQIKSGDPVTYDDNGNVIPLSERFNPENKDIRWSKELFPDDRTMSAEEIERDEIEQYIQQIKSSDDLSDADVQAIRQEIVQSRKQQREQLLAEIATTNLARWGADLGRQEESGKVLSINEAIKKVEESFGVKVTSGGDASVAGSNVSSYNESTRTIRTKFKNDLPAVCHALGYHIDKKLGVVDKAIEQTAEVRRQNGDGEGILEQELKRMVKLEGKDSRKAIKEGFAEFIRMYLVAKNLAQEAAPIFYSEFESMLKEDAELQKAVETSAEAVHGYFVQSAGDRGGAAVMTAEDWKQLNKPRGKEAIRTARDWVIVRLFDRFYGIKSAEKEQNVFDLSTSKSAYVKATLSLTARAKAARLLDDGFYDANGNKIGEGFFDIIEELGAEYTDKFKAFGDYLSFVHALEWIEPNKVAGKKTSSGKDIYNAKAKGKVFADETLNDATELKRLIADMESKHPDFKGIAERIYKYQDNLMNYYLVPSGALSRDQAETFKAQYPHYVPFNRFNTVFGEATKSGKGGNNYFGNLKNPIQKADGGNAPIRHPLESIINSTFSAVDFYMKNDTMKAMIEEFTGNGALPGVMERIYSTEELKKLDEKGNNPFDVEEGKTIDEGKETAFSPVIDKEKGIVYAWVNGEKRFYQIYDRGLYNAVANLEVQNLRGFFRVFNAITNVLKVTMTMRNPLFGPGNFYRDFMTFHYNTTSNANILMQLGMYAGALKSVMKNDTDYQLYKALGGGDMGKFTADMDAIKRTVARRNSKAIKWNEMSARDFGQKVIKNVGGLKFLWDKFFELNDVFETLPRLAEFKYTMESTHGDEQLAMYRSQDVTTNFSRSGSWGRNLNAIFLFSNAELQGIDKMVRNYTEAAYTEKGKNGEPNKAIIAGKILKTVGWSLFMTALSQFINRRDDEAEEEYARLSEFIKNNYDVFYIGNGYFAKVPKEQNLAIPRTVMQRIFDAVKGDDVDFRELGSYIWDGITPGFMPDIFDIKNVPHQIANNTPISVFTDVMANRDFKGAEIVPSYLDGPEYLKYNNYTSALSVGLAKRLYEKTGFDISPMALDHYIGAFGYWGTLFTDLMPYVDVNEKGVAGAIKDNWFNALGVKNKFSVDARYSTDLLNDFYDGRDRAEARLGIDANGENRLVNERYKVLGSLISGYNKRSRIGSEEQQRLDRKILQVILEGFDEGNFSEGEEYVIKLYEATGNEAVFVSSFPGPELLKTDTEKGKKTITTATLDANVYAEYCNEISRMREAVRVLVRDLGLDETEAAEFLAKEYSNINADVTAKYLSLYGKTEETAAEKKETKFDEKAYEKAYEDALNNKIYGD